MTVSPENISIIGAGTMGLGIAQVAALAGLTVQLYDIRQEALDKALQQIRKNLDGAVSRGKITKQESYRAFARIQTVRHLEEINGGVVVEAVPELFDLKRQIFEELAARMPVSTLLATNTSSIPVSRLAEGLPHPERVAGFHFFNPAHIMKLVEVISGEKTSPDTAQTLYNLALRMGKVPVMAKDSPGFIVNRVARHYYLEALKLLEQKVAGVEDIDRLMEASGFRMGPGRLMDLIGVDSNLYTTRTMYEAFGKAARFRPNPIQEEMVAAGRLGRKSGHGFYPYQDK